MIAYFDCSDVSDQRLLSSPRVSDEDKTALRALLAATDPLTLRREIDRDRAQLEEWIKHPEKGMLARLLSLNQKTNSSGVFHN